MSDLHIGYRYFLCQEVERFLGNVPKDYELILNGDIINNPYAKLKPSHQRIMDLIEQVSYRQKIVWVKGNYDNGYIPNGFGKVHFKRLHRINHSLLIAHGDDFDGIMPRNRAFIKAFKMMHNLRVRLGAKPFQKTESAIGPYELQDFNLYYVTRFGFRPSKVAFLSYCAWNDKNSGVWPGILPPDQRHQYDLAAIKRWLGVFLYRFFKTSQFKRSALPNGPKVGSGGSLSPRGDWRAPSDSEATVWLDELRRNVPD